MKYLYLNIKETRIVPECYFSNWRFYIVFSPSFLSPNKIKHFKFPLTKYWLYLYGRIYPFGSQITSIKGLCSRCLPFLAHLKVSFFWSLFFCHPSVCKLLHFNFFSITTKWISTKLSTMDPLVKGIQFYWNKGQALLRVEITKNIFLKC